MGDPGEVPPFTLTETDQQVLASTDEEFQLHTWDELKHIIAENKLEVLKRKPSDLVRYMAWTTKIKAEYCSILDFVCQEKLHWTPLSSSSISTGPLFRVKNPMLFADRDDYKILRNDWPYGISPEITHLVVWLKNMIETDWATGGLTKESRRAIKEFVRTTFADRLVNDGQGEDRVLWFKNWGALQSVRGIDHIHVLVRDAPEATLSKWMG